MFKNGSSVNKVTQRKTNDIAYMWNLKKVIEVNLLATRKWSHRCRKQRREEWGGINWKMEIYIYIVLYVK